MVRVVALISLLAGAALAQEPKAADLQAEDWQVRNATARAMANAGAVDVGELIAVMREEWDGVSLSYGRLGGGRYGGKVTDPTARVVRAAQTSLIGSWYSSVPFDYLDPDQTIVAPAHPHDLALWVLEQHRDRNFKGVAFEPTSVQLACAWLRLHKPDRTQLTNALDGPNGGHIAAALWLAGKSGQATLHELLPQATERAIKAMVSLGHTELFDTPDRIKTLTKFAIEHTGKTARGRAGRLLMNLDDRETVVAALVEGCTSKRTAVRRALGFLCLMEADAAPALETLITHAATPGVNRHRALVALAAIPMPADARKRVAELLSTEFFEVNGIHTRMLILDVLATCGDGVSAGTRKKLQNMLCNADEVRLHARLLGCLRQLGAVPELTAAKKFKVAQLPFANTATWLAVADDGYEGAKLIAPEIGDYMPYVDKKAVLRRLMETTPAEVRKWLNHKDPAVTVAVLEAMPTDKPIEGADSKAIAALLKGDRSVALAAISWLKDRPDASSFAPQVFARMIQLTDKQLPFGCRDFAQEVSLPMPQKLAMLEPILKQGHGWEAVRGEDRPLLRSECRRWLKETDDQDVRVRLLGELCRAGLTTGEDTRLVIAAWKHGKRTLTDALSSGPTLPAPLKAAIEQVLTDEIRQGRTDFYGMAYRARDALRAHR